MKIEPVNKSVHNFIQESRTKAELWIELPTAPITELAVLKKYNEENVKSENVDE